MSTHVEVSCEECGFSHRYGSQAMADHHFPRHSCTYNQDRRARTERHAARLASSGVRVDCTCARIRHEHGTNVAYVVDLCRCYDCKVARRTYEQDRRRRLAYGRSTLTDAQPVREHLQQLMAAGMGVKRIAAVAGLHDSAVSAVIWGSPSRGNPRERRPPRRQIHTVTADRLLAVQVNLADGARILSVGSTRRLRALIAVGWSQSKLATHLGLTTATMQRLVHAGSPVATRATADAVTALYDQLWDAKPTMVTVPDRIAYLRSVRYAADRGWVPPLGWDDDTIDDPAAQPAVTAAQRANAVVDPTDVEMLLDAGHARASILARLQLSASGLQRALERQGRRDVWLRVVEVERARREQPRRAA